MGFNKDIFTVDLMLGIPEKEDRSDWYTFMEPLLRDEESKTMFKMPAQYMFKDIPETGSHDDFVQYALGEMDKHHFLPQLQEASICPVASLQDRLHEASARFSGPSLPPMERE